MINSRFAVLGLALVSVFFTYDLGRGSLSPMRDQSVDRTAGAGFASLAPSVTEVAAKQSFTVPATAASRTRRVTPLNLATLAVATSWQTLYAHAPGGLARGLNQPTTVPSHFTEVEPAVADPILVTEPDSTRALALETVTLQAEPFSPVSL